jgi:hypothetical protein
MKDTLMVFKIILTVAITTLDPGDSQVLLGRGQHHLQCDSTLHKEIVWKGGGNSRCGWRECPHVSTMSEYLTTENQGNIRQARRPVVHRNDNRPLNLQLPHQGLELSLELFPHSFFGLRYIEKM